MTSVLAPIYSARDSAITQRPTSTAILAIDSEDRFRDYDDARTLTGRNRTPYSFSITKNQSLMNGFFTRLGVTEVVFPWTLPNINAATQIIKFRYRANPFAPIAISDIELDIGFYTPSQIASALQTEIRAIDPVNLGAFTMTYGVSSIGIPTTTQFPIFQYQTNGAAQVAFSPMTVADDPLFVPTRKQLFDLLGFSVSPDPPPTPQNKGNNVLAVEGFGTQTYCQFTRYIDIVCTQLTANQALKDTMSQTVARDVMCRVYVGGAPGVQSTVLPSAAAFCPPGCMPTTIYKDFAQPKQIQWVPNQPVPGYLQIDVYDDAGFPLSDYDYANDGNGTNWSMTVLVTEN